MTAVALPPAYFRVVGASALSNLADGIRLAAFPLLAASLTRSATMVALVFAAGQAPGVLLGLWAGAVADRTDRRALIQRVAAVRTILLLALAALVFANLTPLWLLLAASFTLGVAEVMADTTTGTLVPALVPSEHFERANSRIIAAEITGNELAGPALGGLLFAVGASLPFFTNATLLAAAFLLLAGLPVLEQALADEEPEFAAAGIGEPATRFAGAQFIRLVPMLRTITWSSTVLAAVDAAWFALLVLFATNDLGLGAGGFGLLLAVGAVGGLGGAALADRIAAANPSGDAGGRSILPSVAGVVFATNAVSLIALGLAPSLATTIIALVVTSAGFALWNVVMVSARQRATPIEMLGRVGGTYRTIVISAGLVGALVGGVIADAASLPIALAAYGGLVAVLSPVAAWQFRKSLSR